MAPDKKKSMFRHREQRDPLKDQTPGIGKQPYSGSTSDERTSISDEDAITGKEDTNKDK